MKHFKLLRGTHAEGKKIYRKGEVVPSNRDLIANFENKFVLVKESGEPEPKKPAPKKPIRAKVAKKPTPTPKKEKKEDAPKEKQEGAKVGDLGKDVTAEYEQAQNFGLKVYRRRDLHTVIDPSEPNTPLNEKGLRSEHVETFVERYFDDE